MKITKSVFGKEWKELEKFNKLDLAERSIVFYSESSVILYPYAEELINELEKRGQKICYVTSSKDDPIFKNENKNIKSFYIGEGAARTMFFMELKARVLIMTMADLETYYIKRSKTFPVNYIYLFHSVNSPLKGFQSGKDSKGAFDHYDTIFCVGPHQIQEFRAREQLYNLKQKNLVECGYGLFDKLLKTKPLHAQQNLLSKNGKKKILIAPSWGKQNLLETVGIDLVKILLDAGYHVTVRPHPMIIKNSSKIIKKIREKFEGNADFILDADTSSFEQLFSSYALITDWSGISYEYAFVCERPVIYVDDPKNAHNKEYDKIKSIPLEISIRDKIGEIISVQNLEKLPERIEFLCGHITEFQSKIKKIRDDTIFNIGKSGKVAADEINKIINGERHDQNSF